MQLQDITTSLELSKQLKEAGYPQDSLFYYHIFESKAWEKGAIKTELRPALQTNMTLSIRLNESSWKRRDVISAPTASELGEALRGNEFNLPEMYTGHHWIQAEYGVLEDSEANARAKMWLHLKENGLLPIIKKDKV